MGDELTANADENAVDNVWYISMVEKVERKNVRM
jgi:hypothetical protein